MLQQTQTARVFEKYPLFIKAFPDFRMLAKAPTRKLLKTWIGMGYNRRALYLKQIAKTVIKNHTGDLSRDPETLRILPGIGHYTAHAVACFSYNNCAPFLDTNIRRVIIHFFFPRKKQVRDSEILKVLKRVEPRKNKREWYLALMDYGATSIPKTGKNPNRRSRHYARQTRFEGSTREVRSLVIKELLTYGPKATQALKKSIRRKGAKPALLTTPQFSRVLETMKRNGLIKQNNGLWNIV